MIAFRQRIRRVELGGRTLHLISNKDPEVALDLSHSLHELLGPLRRLQVLVLRNQLAHVGLELFGIVVVLDPFLARLADLAGARAAAAELLRIAQMLVVFGVEADLTHRGRGARLTQDKARVDGALGEGALLVAVATLLVQEIGDILPCHGLLVAQGGDQLVLRVIRDVGAHEGDFVEWLEHSDVVFDVGLDGASVVQSVHARRVAHEVLSAIQCSFSCDHERFLIFFVRKLVGVAFVR
jgi:hypothetical protein